MVITRCGLFARFFRAEVGPMVYYSAERRTEDRWNGWLKL